MPEAGLQNFTVSAPGSVEIQALGYKTHVRFAIRGFVENDEAGTNDEGNCNVAVVA
jgi:hypothetical protein